MPGPAIQIRGLGELSRALKDVDDELPKELRRGLKAIADKVASGIRGRAPKGPSGKFSSRIVGRATQKSASISWPRTAVPYAGFVEFGNVTGRGGGIGPGDSNPRPYRQEGRYIFPYVEDHRTAIEGDIQSLVSDVLRKADLT